MMSVPSPPSANGSLVTSTFALVFKPASMALQTSNAVNEPLNLSGTIRILITEIF